MFPCFPAVQQFTRQPQSADGGPPALAMFRFRTVDTTDG